MDDELIIHFDGNTTPQVSFGWVASDGTDGMGTPDPALPQTNNVAEYTGLIHALQYVLDAYGPRDVTLRGDSQLVVRQMNGEYEVKEEHLVPLFERASALVEEIQSNGYYVGIEWVRREENGEADKIGRIGHD